MSSEGSLVLHKYTSTKEWGKVGPGICNWPCWIREWVRNKSIRCLVRLTFIFDGTFYYFFFHPLTERELYWQIVLSPPNGIYGQAFLSGAVLIILFACLHICTPIPPVVRFQVLEQIKHGCSHILELRSLNNRVCLCGVFMPLHSERGTYQYRYGCVYTLIWIFINLSRRGLLEICHFSLVEWRRIDFFPISMHFYFHLCQIWNMLITYTNFRLKNYCFTFQIFVYILSGILGRQNLSRIVKEGTAVKNTYFW